MIGSVKRGTATGKEGSWEVFFLPEMALRSDRFELVASQVADLAQEMTENAVQEASMYLRR